MRRSSRGNPYHDERGRFCSGPRGKGKYTVSEKTPEEYEEQTKMRAERGEVKQNETKQYGKQATKKRVAKSSKKESSPKRKALSRESIERQFKSFGASAETLSDGGMEVTIRYSQKIGHDYDADTEMVGHILYFEKGDFSSKSKFKKAIAREMDWLSDHHNREVREFVRATSEFYSASRPPKLPTTNKAKPGVYTYDGDKVSIHNMDGNGGYDMVREGCPLKIEYWPAFESFDRSESWRVESREKDYSGRWRTKRMKFHSMEEALRFIKTHDKVDSSNY